MGRQTASSQRSPATTGIAGLVALVALSLLVPQACAAEADFSDKAVVGNVLQTASAIGALDQCEQAHGYKITGKTDEVAYRKLVAVFMQAKRRNDAMGAELARMADAVLQGSGEQGVWIVVNVIDTPEGQKINGTRIEANSEGVCASIEAYLRDQMKSGKLLDIPGDGEIGADAGATQ